MARGLSRQLTKAILLSCLLSGLGGCKTIENAVTRATSTTDETFTGKFVTVADSRRLATDNANGGSRLGLVGVESQGSPDELPNSALLAAYAQEVLTRVLAGYPYPHPPIPVRITRKTSFTAEATPLGAIELPQGLLVNVESEDELAFALAHEASHILLNHHTQDEIVQKWSGARALGAGAGLEVARNLSSEVAKQTGQKWIVAAFLAVELIDRRLLAPAWRRSQEEEADLLGLDLAIAAGYSLVGAQTVFERSEDQERRIEEGRQKQLAAQAALNESLKAQGNINEAMKRSLSTALNEPIKALLVNKEGLSAEHPAAKDRENLVLTYVDREYRGAPLPELSTGRYRTRALTGAAGQALTREVNLLRSDGLLQKGDFTKSAEVLNTLLKDPRDPSADIRERLYKVHLAAGAPDKAADQLEFAINDPTAEERLYDLLIDLYVATSQPTKALAAIDRLTRKNRAREESLTPRRVELLYQSGRVAEGDRVARQCEAYGERRFDIVVQCRAIMERRRPSQS